MGDEIEWAKRKEEFGKIFVAPFDARFPEQNQTGHCFTYYLDYHRCKNFKGEDYKPCEYFKKVYKDMCPGFWVEKWDSWVDEGRFPARFDI